MSQTAVNRILAECLAAGLLLALGCGGADPEATTENFTVADGLELTVWASEPLLVNPTNFDIDARGRIWFIESVNYRTDLRDLPKNDKQGDRIVILEDTDLDGKADSRKIFDQTPELLAPLGISVFGDKVVVSQSPNLIVYTKDEQDRIVNREVLLTGWGGVDHDHGLHVVVFGPDGRYYFNNGDQGFDVTDRSGRRFVSSQQGPYYAATVQRMNPDGTDFEVLGHNFRNPYELAIDSFGTICQTDNDDDGNQWTRLLYVMEGGNFGYWGPGGRRWREDRGSHFHMENPGVVPFIARTGAGSPTGVVIYDGTLLPEKYRGNLLHAEPGKRVIQAFFLTPDGAGYKMESENIVTAEEPYFRPSDLAVAPDGAVFISDWYDPIVGGHQMRDIEKGRIYRLAPKGHKASAGGGSKSDPKVDLQSKQGLRNALRSPAQAVRYLAYQELKLRGEEAKPWLLEWWGGDDRVLRARSLWLLAPLGAEGRQAVEQALGADDPDFRILGIRVARANAFDVPPMIEPLLGDPSPLVRREIALALQHVDGSKRLRPWVELAKQYDGQDRWYLEALAIAARDQEEELYPLLRKAFPAWNSRLADLLWVLHPKAALPFLTQSLRNPQATLEQRAEALKALGAQPSAEAAETIAKVLTDSNASQSLKKLSLERLSKQLFSEWTAYRSHPAVIAAITAALAAPTLQNEAVALANELEDPGYGPRLLLIAQSDATNGEVRANAVVALGATGQAQYAPVLSRLAEDAGIVPSIRIAAVRGLTRLQPPDLEPRMKALLLTDAPNEVRSEALRALGRRVSGLNLILDLEETQQLPAELRTLATLLVNTSPDEQIASRAKTILPPLVGKGESQVRNPRAYIYRQGDPGRGREIFFAKDGARCTTCHGLEDGEQRAGPNLATIGSKLGKEALADAILNPSAGIAHGYDTWIIETKTQGMVTGVLVEDTAERIVLRTETNDEIRLSANEISARRKSNLSMMPEDLVTHLTDDDMVNLLEFLTTLKSEAPSNTE